MWGKEAAVPTEKPALLPGRLRRLPWPLRRHAAKPGEKLLPIEKECVRRRWLWRRQRQRRRRQKPAGQRWTR